MKVTFDEVIRRCKRDNYESNNRLHWFSSKFSLYFSYLFIRLGMSADTVTAVFFILGFIGALLFNSTTIFLSILGYIFFRLHVIIDMSDGDVARFHKSFSIRGSYWDSVIHSILNPLYYMSISFSYYFIFGELIFLIITPFIVLSSSLVMAVKNNFFKALYFNKKNENKSQNKMSPIKYKLYYFLSEIISIEGFILTAVFVKFIKQYELAIFQLIFFLISNIFVACLKFYNYSYRGSTFSKS